MFSLYFCVFLFQFRSFCFCVVSCVCLVLFSTEPRDWLGRTSPEWPICAVLDVPSVLWRCWLGGRKGIRPVKKQSGGVLVWLSLWSNLQTCIWPSWFHCHSPSLASVKSRLVFTFLVPARPGSPGKRAFKRLCVCVGHKTLFHPSVCSSAHRSQLKHS